MARDGGAARSWRGGADASSKGRVKTSRGTGIMAGGGPVVAGGGRQFTVDGVPVVAAGVGHVSISSTNLKINRSCSQNVKDLVRKKKGLFANSCLSDSW